MGVAVTITRTEHTAAELRAFAAKSQNTAQSRRLLAIAMVLDGASRGEAALQTGMDRQSLRDWVHRYNETGIAGLLPRLPPGPKPKLTTAQMAELRELVLAGPVPKQHKVVRWRCLDLRQEVAQRFKVTVPERTIGKWLRKLKLTRLQPRPFHPKKDDAAQQAFKQNFCALLKTPCLAAPSIPQSRSGFRMRPGSDRRTHMLMYGLRWDRGRRWCAITVTTPPTSLARYVPPAASARR